MTQHLVFICPLSSYILLYIHVFLPLNYVPYDSNIKWHIHILHKFSIIVPMKFCVTI